MDDKFNRLASFVFPPMSKPLLPWGGRPLCARRSGSLLSSGGLTAHRKAHLWASHLEQRGDAMTKDKGCQSGGAETKKKSDTVKTNKQIISTLHLLVYIYII